MDELHLTEVPPLPYRAAMLAQATGVVMSRCRIPAADGLTLIDELATRQRLPGEIVADALVALSTRNETLAQIDALRAGQGPA